MSRPRIGQRSPGPLTNTLPTNRSIGKVGRVFASGLRDRGSIPDRIIHIQLIPSKPQQICHYRFISTIRDYEPSHRMANNFNGELQLFRGKDCSS